MKLFLFKATHFVVKAERLCRKAGLKGKIIPVPRSISSECGMAIEIEGNEQKLVALLEEAEIWFKVVSDYKK